MMNLARMFGRTLRGALLALASGAVLGQPYPSKPIHIYSAEPGSSADLMARLVAQGMAASMGQPVIVENRGGTLAVETVSKMPPDGYALVFYGSVMWLSPFLRENSAWDPLRDFIPITVGATQPNVLVVHPSLPVKSVTELIALAKARPGDLNYATSGTGGASHLAAELFRSMAGINMVRIPYKGTPTALIDMVGGRTQVMFCPLGSVAVHLKSGRLRALAVSSAQSTPLAPGLPPVGAALPGYESVSIIGTFAPAKTPGAIVQRIHQEIARALHTPEAKEKLFGAGMDPGGDTPEHFMQTLKSEMSRMGKLIREQGIRAD